MNYLYTFIYYASWLLFLFLFLQSSYLFAFAVAGRLMSLKPYKHATTTGRFVVYLFSSHDEETIHAVNAFLSLSYPADKKHLVVIGQTLSSATKQFLHDHSVECVESKDKNSKQKALQAAIERTGYEADYALLLDARHICTKGFLYRMNDALQSGCDAVQGQRMVQNTASLFGLLDAISEGVDTHIFCKSQQLAGLSSSFTGSGSAIRFSLLRDVVAQLPVSGNFAKAMELHLLRKRISIAYVPKAFLYEERKHQFISSEEKYKQWTTSKSAASQAYHSACFTELKKGNADFLNKVFQGLLLPRILLLGITSLVVVVSFLNVPVPASSYWIVLWLITYAAIFMSMPARYITNRFLRAVFFLPFLFIDMAKLFFKARKKQAHTLYFYTV